VGTPGAPDDDYVDALVQALTVRVWERRGRQWIAHQAEVAARLHPMLRS
jgi:hypothetical protein